MSLEVKAERACETCGRTFVGRPRQSQRFCGPRCQARSYRQRGAVGSPGAALHQVYRCFDEHGILLYVGCSANALTRLNQHRTASGWFWRVRKVMIEHFPNWEAAALTEAKAILSESPRYNVDDSAARVILQRAAASPEITRSCSSACCLDTPSEGSS
jgi:hypothetical protein